MNNLLRKAELLPPASVTRVTGDRPTRQFVAYDGEGHDNKYTLLANSLGESIQNPDGLSTADCLELLSQRYDDRYFRVFYGFDYDVNHIIRDLPDEKQRQFLAGNVTKWGGHILRYYPGKVFDVDNLLYYDVIAFFQRSFIETVRLMLGEGAISKQLIEGKAARGSFETWSTDKILEYNQEELELLVRVMDKFRQSLVETDVVLHHWYGPGAIANYWMGKHGIKTPNLPRAVESALNSAYFGGRFEQIGLGRHRPVYEYDIRSAYPAVMSTMPNFTRWHHTDKYEPHPYSIWHVSVDLRPWFEREDARIDHRFDRFTSDLTKSHANAFMPLPMRNRQGIINFPMIIKGWYWNDELRLVDHFIDPGWDLQPLITVHEGYVADTEGQPFSWVKDLYEYRMELKRSGNLAEYGVKVGLNSLYGKTAQRVGEAKYHSLAWAGYITSSVRAKIANAGYTAAGYKQTKTNASKIIGFATDAIFSTERLALPISNNLGDWEESKFAEGIFIQSGIYRLRNSDDEYVDRYRGNPMRKGLDNILEQLKIDPFDDPYILKQQFVSHKLANIAPEVFGPHRLEFTTVKQYVRIPWSIKRHYMFPQITVENLTLTDIGRLLKEPIESFPMIHMDDKDRDGYANYRKRVLTTTIDDLPESYAKVPDREEINGLIVRDQTEDENPIDFSDLELLPQVLVGGEKEAA